MQLYKNFCKETTDENGKLTSFELVFPENYNFGYDVVDKMAELAPNDTAVVWTNPEKEEKIFTYSDISRLSNKAANVFRNHGIKKGDKVLVILKRNYEYWYVAPALHKLGAVIIPATNLLTQSDISYRVNTAGIKAAVCTPDETTAEDMLAVASQPNTLETVFVPRRQIFGAVDFTEEVENAPDTLERVETKAEEPMVIYFTSGTTGYPKAVEHNHIYTLGHIITAKYWQCVKDGGLHLTVAETGWAKASWGKIYGQWLCGSAVMVYDFDKFSPGKLLRIMEKYKVTTFCAPPTVYRYFIKRGMDKYDLSALSHLTTAGEALNNEVFEKVHEQELNFVRASVRQNLFLCLQTSRAIRLLQAQWASLLRCMMSALLTMSATRLSKERSARLLYFLQRTENSTEFSSHTITMKNCTKRCGGTVFITRATPHIRMRTDIFGMSAEPMISSKQEASE